MLIWFVLAHVALGGLVFAWRPVATVHVWLCIAFGVWLAASAKRPSSIAMFAAYVVGAEVLWRMGKATVPWETGKYFVTVLLLIGLARFPRPRSSGLAIGYFALLLPGIVLTVQNAIDFTSMRQQISFNLSGPLSLAVAAYFFRQVTLSKTQLGQILVAALGPVISIATLTVLSTYSQSDLLFQDASNFASSGGYGPNQVSSVLSMGVVLCFLLLATEPNLGIRRRGIVFTTLAVCAVQSAMTFSRGGLYMVVMAMAGASLFLLGDRSGRRMVVATAMAIALLFVFIAPQLDRVTAGALATRFQDPSMTNREDLIQNDLQLWAEHPLSGVGVGQGNEARAAQRFSSSSAHTEWTRMLGEHGAFGLASMLVLLAMMIGNVLRARGPAEKAVVAGLVLWGSLFLTINAMRIAAPGFLFGLTCATFELSAGWRPTGWRRRNMRVPL